MNALSIKGLRKEYKNFCLEDFDLELPHGCIVGLIGTNGAGKSTIIKSIVGMIKPTEGEIRFEGKYINEKSMDDIGVVLDSGCLPEKISCRALGKLMSKCYKNWDSEAYSGYLAKFKLDEKKKVKELSRGMVMKLSLALALSHNAKLLILDEATAGLDVVVRDEVLDILLDFISDGQRSVLISSHIVSDLEKVCDYICFINNGKLLLMEEKDALIESFCLVRCSKSEFERFSDDAVGARVSEFGVEALIKRDKVPSGIATEKAGIDDIILFHVKGEK